MTKLTLAERNRAFEETEARHLAIQAGIWLTEARYRGMPDVVLSRAILVQAWLLAGSGDDDMRARRRAVLHHMRGLTEAAKYAGGPVRCTPEDFIAGAEKYYAALTGGQP
jgi:hypothetical protein